MRPLDGVLVVEAATWISGPLAAQALADLGAEVVKVEAPDGDPMRRYGRCVGGLSLLWLAVNRLRRHVTLDLSGPGGRRELDELLARADVLVTNWRPGVSDRLGLDATAVARRHPRLVWCRISGFGQDGPRSGDPAFDTVLQAATGLAVAQGGNGPPQLVRSFLGDKITSAYAAQAVLAALVRRGTTGVGGVVDVSMLDALAHFDWPDLGVSRALPADSGGSGVDAQLAAIRPVPTADGWVVVAAARRRHMRAACTVAGHPEWFDRLVAADPTQMAGTFLTLLGDVSPTHTTEWWLAALRAADVPVAEVMGLDGHLADPQVRHNGTYTEGDHPVVGRYRYARHPARWGG